MFSCTAKNTSTHHWFDDVFYSFQVQHLEPLNIVRREVGALKNIPFERTIPVIDGFEGGGEISRADSQTLADVDPKTWGGILSEDGLIPVGNSCEVFYRFIRRLT